MPRFTEVEGTGKDSTELSAPTTWIARPETMGCASAARTEQDEVARRSVSGWLHLCTENAAGPAAAVVNAGPRADGATPARR